jgi:peptidoglycan hydrolase-like protein with peptidoglycan-binding domain
MFLRIILIALVVTGLAGCATSKKSLTLKEQEDLKMKVTDLETQVQEKDAQIQQLESEIQTSQRSVVSQQSFTGESVSMTPKQIQRSLRNAGYYSGPIDGVIGNMTKRAVKSFQRDNGLVVDGIVGRETKSALRKYLE